MPEKSEKKSMKKEYMCVCACVCVCVCVGSSLSFKHVWFIYKET